MKRNTQKRVAALLGVDRSTVEKWFHPKSSGHNGNVPNMSLPDARVKIPPTVALGSSRGFGTVDGIGNRWAI